MHALNSDWRKSSREEHSGRRQGCKGCKHAPAVLVCRLKSPRPTECEVYMETVARDWYD